MRSLSVLMLLLLLLAGMGCTGQKETVQRQVLLLDSLRVENERWRARTQTFRDSIQFYDDVDSGRYYRQLRVLNDQLNRARYDILTLRDGGRTAAVITADALFEPASATLTEPGRTRLDTLAAHLRTAYPERRLRVEGHSDNLALSPDLQEQYPSNWELSAARASAVVRYLIAAHDFMPARLAVAAFAATRPVASNETVAGRRRNRRVRIAVMPPPRSYERPFEVAW